MQSGEPDADDDLGTFERIPEKDDRGIELEMNIRYNLRGCVVIILLIFRKHSPLIHDMGAGPGNEEELLSLIKWLHSRTCTMTSLLIVYRCQKSSPFKQMGTRGHQMHGLRLRPPRMQWYPSLEQVPVAQFQPIKLLTCLRYKPIQTATTQGTYTTCRPTPTRSSRTCSQSSNRWSR